MLIIRKINEIRQIKPSEIKKVRIGWINNGEHFSGFSPIEAPFESVNSYVGRSVTLDIILNSEEVIPVSFTEYPTANYANTPVSFRRVVAEYKNQKESIKSLEPLSGLLSFDVKTNTLEQINNEIKEKAKLLTDYMELLIFGEIKKLLFISHSDVSSASDPRLMSRTRHNELDDYIRKLKTGEAADHVAE